MGAKKGDCFIIEIQRKSLDNKKFSARHSFYTYHKFFQDESKEEVEEIIEEITEKA
ncbi:MAG: hypothetical protein Q4D65_10785 [Peptostreptococcaceae bacterium]|nr:hypothetical protein [Peptostreptococcaceae bacterium]